MRWPVRRELPLFGNQFHYPMIAGDTHHGWYIAGMSSLLGKVMLVTGASSGLGAETARLLSREGATVFGIARNADRLAEVFHDVEAGAYASLDIGSASACHDAVARCVAQFGRLDVLINIAGSHRMRRTESMT